MKPPANEDEVNPTRRRLRATYDAATKPGGFEPTRRDALKGGAASWVTVSLAGCSAIVGDSDSEPTNYVVTDEMIAGGGNIPPGAGGFVKGCAPQRQFVPGMQAVFKVGVFDPATGEQVTDETIDSMTIELDNGESVEMEWAGDDEEHPAEEWTGSWEVPTDAGAGAISYTVEISNGENYRNVGILENQFTIIEFGGASTYVVEADTTTTSSNIPGEVGVFGGSCSPQEQFVPGMDVIFHVAVWDPKSGSRVGPDAVESLNVELENGVTVDMEWLGDAEEHPADEWQGKWVVPDDAEPGSFKYTVNLQTDGNAMTVGVLEDSITIGQWPPAEE